MSGGNTKKPHVVVLGGVEYLGDDYLNDFRNEFELEFLNAKDRTELKEKLPLIIANKSPVDALIITADYAPYAPLDEELLGSLVPHCRILCSAWAGYNEYDVSWVTSQNMWFCNTVDAVAEATADMALFLILAVVRNTYVAEKLARRGSGTTP
ncbi:Putative 2-hydroxyacid dehydrogenase [Cladobotryum mycophilum]|uniref:2-hydroxyacid dehydrogenase n=1 Tax=Cladobotryum mycophilum TaxID=491253 RepID=A0ABR0SX66_9HYPO